MRRLIMIFVLILLIASFSFANDNIVKLVSHPPYATQATVSDSIGDHWDEWLHLSGGTMTGNITMSDDGWIGFGSSIGRIRFETSGVDTIGIENAVFRTSGTMTAGGQIILDDNDAGSPAISFVSGDDLSCSMYKTVALGGVFEFYNLGGGYTFLSYGDYNDYIWMDTFSADVPLITTSGDCDLHIDAESGNLFLDAKTSVRGNLKTIQFMPQDITFNIDVNSAWAPHAVTYDSTITHDGWGVALHPDVAFDPDGWNSYLYWMVFTPYNTSAQENPNVLASNDKRTWEVPGGGRVLVDSNTFADSHNSDPDWLWGKDGKAWVVWRWTTDGADEDSVFVSYSTDGQNWSTRECILTSTTEGYTSPAWIIDEDENYRIYYIDIMVDTAQLKYRTCSTPNGTWSGATTCTIDSVFNGKESWWHININRLSGQYFCLLNNETTPLLYLATSYNGDTWEVSKKPFLDTGKSGQFDDKEIYRSAGFPMFDGGLKFALWYSGKKNSWNKYHIGYTEVYFDTKIDVFDNFHFANDDVHGDSITVWQPAWEITHPHCFKIENESGQDDQFDTSIFSAIVPDAVPYYFDSTALCIDSIYIPFKTASTDTTVTGIRWRMLRLPLSQEMDNGIFEAQDTIDIIGTDTLILIDTDKSWTAHDYDNYFVECNGKLYHIFYNSTCSLHVVISNCACWTGGWYRIVGVRYDQSDTISIYDDNRRYASSTANMWKTLCLDYEDGDYNELFPHDILEIMVITNADAGDSAKIENPKLFYRRR